MQISVIVPSYKPQSYLWECLNSIYNQTFSKSDYELVLVLNGCCEPYNSQIKDWLSNHADLQVQYFQTDEGGVSNARNIALDKVNGEYVTFIDDDDLISPMYLEELYEKVNPDTVSVCYPYAFNDGYIEKQLPYAITEAYDHCVKYNSQSIISMARKYFSGPCMKLIPMSFIHDRRFDVRFRNGEDSLFMFLISDKVKQVTFTSKKAIYYRRYRQGSALFSMTLKQCLVNSFQLIKSYSQIWSKRPLEYSFVFYATRVLGAFHTMHSYCMRYITVFRH